MLGELNAAILERVALGGPDTARTTLALALLRPGDDLLAFASLGDSHVFQLTAGEVLELGHEDGAPHLLPRLRIRDGGIARGQVRRRRAAARRHARRSCSSPMGSPSAGSASPFRRTRSPSARSWPRAALPELRPLGAARGVVERALAEHRRHRAGDNVAAAVAWP